MDPIVFWVFVKNSRAESQNLAHHRSISGSGTRLKSVATCTREAALVPVPDVRCETRAVLTLNIKFDTSLRLCPKIPLTILPHSLHFNNFASTERPRSVIRSETKARPPTYNNFYFQLNSQLYVSPHQLQQSDQLPALLYSSSVLESH